MTDEIQPLSAEWFEQVDVTKSGTKQRVPLLTLNEEGETVKVAEVWIESQHSIAGRDVRFVSIDRNVLKRIIVENLEGDF